MTEKEAVTRFVAELRVLKNQNGAGSLMDAYRQYLEHDDESARWVTITSELRGQNDRIAETALGVVSKDLAYKHIALASSKLLPILQKLDLRDAAQA